MKKKTKKKKKWKASLTEAKNWFQFITLEYDDLKVALLHD